MIERFYAVTTTSLYEVSAEKDGLGIPLVVKLALKGASLVKVGGRLHNGRLIAVTRLGLILYDEEFPRPGRRQRIEEVSFIFWGGNTSPIIGLFLDIQEAIICFNCLPNVKFGDKRWQKETQEVLDSIGDHHPVFVLSRRYSIKFN